MMKKYIVAVALMMALENSIAMEKTTASFDCNAHTERANTEAKVVLSYLRK